jgi:hypothetical protein
MQLFVVQNPKSRLEDPLLGRPNPSKRWLLEFIHKTGPWSQVHARGRPATTADKRREGMRLLSRVLYHLSGRESSNIFDDDLDDDLVDTITVILCLQRLIWAEGCRSDNLHAVVSGGKPERSSEAS